MITDFLETVWSFSNMRILVIGDLMLDHYIIGVTDRTSPEAPVPVVLVREESWMPGGAANVARNIVSAGCQVVCCGMVGDDDAGRILLSKLAEAGVSTENVITFSGQTIVKTRVVSQGQQIVRLDREKRVVAGPVELERLREILQSVVRQLDGVILSDYGKGFLSNDLISEVISLAAGANVKVFVDPKGREYAKYHGAYAITPNSREAQEVTGVGTDSRAGLERAAESIHEMTGCEIAMITRGSEGLAYRTRDGQMVLMPTLAREVFDVTGAGDTFVAWLTMGIAAKLDTQSAAHLANIAAGIAVARTGPATVSPLDLRQAMAPGRLGKKIIGMDDLARLGTQLRGDGKSVVLTNGCFDFLHAGHVAFLQEAREQGDVLIVATNTDEVIKALKGGARPIITRKQREELLASIEAVDYVVVFPGNTPHEVIHLLHPDVLVKGANYTLSQVEGADDVEQYGGRVVTLPIQHDFHTDQLVGRNRNGGENEAAG